VVKVVAMAVSDESRVESMLSSGNEQPVPIFQRAFAPRSRQKVAPVASAGTLERLPETVPAGAAIDDDQSPGISQDRGGSFKR
jgi:hypothetical protein